MASLFRSEVLNQKKDRLSGEVSIAVPMPWQLIGYLNFGGVVAAATFLSLASYSRVENILTIWLAVGFVIEGAGSSVGMVFAYMAYKNQFITKSAALIDQAIQFKMLGLHLPRLSDIALTDEDRSFGDSFETTTQLKGKIELRDVHYRYSPSDPLVLQGVNLTIEQGDHVAITGPSGGAKAHC